MEADPSTAVPTTYHSTQVRARAVLETAALVNVHKMIKALDRSAAEMHRQARRDEQAASIQRTIDMFKSSPEFEQSGCLLLSPTIEPFELGGTYITPMQKKARVTVDDSIVKPPSSMNYQYHIAAGTFMSTKVGQLSYYVHSKTDNELLNGPTLLRVQDITVEYLMDKQTIIGIIDDPTVRMDYRTKGHERYHSTPADINGEDPFKKNWDHQTDNPPNNYALFYYNGNKPFTVGEYKNMFTDVESSLISHLPASQHSDYRAFAAVTRNIRTVQFHTDGQMRYRLAALGNLGFNPGLSSGDLGRQFAITEDPGTIDLGSVALQIEYAASITDNHTERFYEMCSLVLDTMLAACTKPPTDKLPTIGMHTLGGAELPETGFVFAPTKMSVPIVPKSQYEYACHFPRWQTNKERAASASTMLWSKISAARAMPFAADIGNVDDIAAMIAQSEPFGTLPADCARFKKKVLQEVRIKQAGLASLHLVYCTDTEILPGCTNLLQPMKPHVVVFNQAQQTTKDPRFTLGLESTDVLESLLIAITLLESCTSDKHCRQYDATYDPISYNRNQPMAPIPDPKKTDSEYKKSKTTTAHDPDPTNMLYSPAHPDGVVVMEQYTWYMGLGDHNVNKSGRAVLGNLGAATQQLIGSGPGYYQCVKDTTDNSYELKKDVETNGRIATALEACKTSTHSTVYDDTQVITLFEGMLNNARGDGQHKETITVPIHSVKTGDRLGFIKIDFYRFNIAFDSKTIEISYGGDGVVGIYAMVPNLLQKTYDGHIVFTDAVDIRFSPSAPIHALFAEYDIITDNSLAVFDKATRFSLADPDVWELNQQAYTTNNVRPRPFLYDIHSVKLDATRLADMMVGGCDGIVHTTHQNIDHVLWAIPFGSNANALQTAYTRIDHRYGEPYAVDIYKSSSTQSKYIGWVLSGLRSTDHTAMTVTDSNALVVPAVAIVHPTAVCSAETVCIVQGMYCFTAMFRRCESYCMPLIINNAKNKGGRVAQWIRAHPKISQLSQIYCAHPHVIPHIISIINDANIITTVSKQSKQGHSSISLHAATRSFNTALESILM